MMRRKLGYHHLILPDGSQKNLVVVEVEGDQIIAWHPLRGEEPNVEWVGGTCRMEK